MEYSEDKVKSVALTSPANVLYCCLHQLVYLLKIARALFFFDKKMHKMHILSQLLAFFRKTSVL